MDGLGKPRALVLDGDPVPKVLFEGGSERRLRRESGRPPLGFSACARRPVILKTDRLTLRPQEQADAPALFAILSDSEAMRFWNRPPVTRLTVVEEMVCEQQAAMAEGLCRYWTVTRSNEAIGSIDLSLIRGACAELGFLLRRDCWGFGLMTEAVGAVAAHGFSALHLTQLAAVVQTANRAAARVLEKNTFRLVESRPAQLPDGAYRDCAFYLRDQTGL